MRYLTFSWVPWVFIYKLWKFRGYGYSIWPLSSEFVEHDNVTEDMETIEVLRKSYAET